MCVKLSPGDLNLDSYPSHPTSTYTCEVTLSVMVSATMLIQTKIGKNMYELD